MQQTQRYQMTQLVFMVMAFARCRHWSAQMFKTIGKRIVGGEQLKLTELSAFLFATSIFSVNLNDRVREILLQQLLRNFDKINIGATYQIFRTAVLSRCYNDKLIQLFCKKVSQTDVEFIATFEINQLFQTYLILESRGKGEIFKSCISNKILVKARLSWRKQINRQNSTIQKKVYIQALADVFNTLGYKSLLGQLTDDRCCLLHLVLKQKGKQDIAVLVETRYRFAQNFKQHRLRVGHILEELLRYRGWEVIVVQLEQFLELKTDQKRQEYLQQLLKSGGS
eukprot:TRINITY_DN2636_c0_g3_i1.p2 TRINITY_DN2636_c0_g3~~TRINITY_DN2636_c0_g3_i1.p2  ORF type:complete len:309 (-),score=21.84 TRINITY_DN2636_c0_g3_i1:466-1311(-)